MEEMNLNGFQMAHLDNDMHSILKEKRQVLRMTQQEVAEKAKITLQQYQKFESGERNIRTASFQLACRVIEALGMNISDFFHGEYVWGEQIYAEADGLHYKKTGEHVNKDFT